MTFLNGIAIINKPLNQSKLWIIAKKALGIKSVMLTPIIIATEKAKQKVSILTESGELPYTERKE